MNKETNIDKVNRKLTMMIDFVINYRAVKILKKLEDNDILDIWEKNQPQDTVVKPAICYACVSVLRERHPKAVELWMQNPERHLRSVIGGVVNE